MLLGLRAPALLAALFSAAALAVGGALAPVGRWRTAAVRWRPAALLGGGFLLGGLLGAFEGESRRQACTSALLTGDTVSARGVVAARPGAAGRQRTRLRLRDVSIRAAGRACTVPSLMARVSLEGGPPSPGAVVLVRGEWMRFDTDRAWPAGPDRQGLLTGAAVVGGSRGGGADRPLLLRLRGLAAERLSRRLPRDVAPTALALLLAERDEVDADLRRRFVEAGLAHLLAISGMHVGLLAAGAVWLLGVRLPPRHRTAVALVLVAGYVLVIGAPPAARRALVMFSGYVWGRLRGWPIRPGELLGTALLAVLLVAPGSVLDPGLQLSFAGFAGVVAGGRAATAFAPVRGRFARGRAGSIGRAAGAGAGAVLATTPITAFHFGQTTPVSLLSHFAGGPLVGFALGSLAATLALPGILAAPAADVATGSLRALHAVADLFSRVPGGHRAVPAPPAAVWCAWLLALVAVHRLLAFGAPRAALGPGVLALAVLASGPALQQAVGGRPGGLAGSPLLCTLSVGQGDAAVLRTGAGRWLLFDGGPAWGDWNAGAAVVHPFLRRHGARRVEVAVLSHPDLDHLGGLRGLLPLIRIERVLDSGDPVPSDVYAKFLAELDATDTRWLPAAAGDRIRVDDVELTVLGPGPAAPTDAGGSARGTNSTSLSFRLTVAGGFRYMNTGDATSAEEAALLASWPAESLRADVLKVGHHGSRTSSGADFVRAVAPRLAVVSSGSGNRYGHPHQEVLDRLRSGGVERVWRTDRHGTLCLEIRADGRWRVRGETAWTPAASVPAERPDA